MSYSNNAKMKEVATVADLSSASDWLTFTPAVPVEVEEFGVVVTTAMVDAAGGAVLKADVRPTAGSDTNRTDGTAGVMTLTSAQANQVAGKVVRCRPTAPLTVYPGQQVVLQATTAVDSGAGIAFIVYREALKLDSSVETVVAA